MGDRRVVRIEARDVDGQPAVSEVQLELADGRRLPLTCGTVMQVPPGRILVHCDAPPGQWGLEPDGRWDDGPDLLLQEAWVEVQLADASGRELGGLPVSLVGSGGMVQGRVGMPLRVWAGSYTLAVGGVGEVSRQTFVLEVPPGRSSVALGRLGELEVSWGQGRGWPVRLSLEALEPVISAPPLSEPCLAEHRCRVGTSLSIWPGRYRVDVSGGPSGVIQVEAGRLCQLALTAPVPRRPLDQDTDRLSKLVGGLAWTLRRIDTRLPPAVRRLVRPWLGAVPPREEGGDARAQAEGRGPCLRALLKDPRGHDLIGWPYVLTGTRPGLPRVEGRIGLACPVVPGRYRFELEGLPLIVEDLEVGSGGRTEALAPLAQLEVHLRDGEGRSLRGARLRLASCAGTVEGMLGQPLLLPAGVWRVGLEEPLPLQAEVTLKAGEVKDVDLGAFSRLLVAPHGDLPAGSPVRVALEGVQGGLSVAWAQGASQPGEWQGQVGVPLELLPGEYRVWEGEAGGEGRRVVLKPGRRRKPSVAGRSAEPLAAEDANRDGAGPGGAKDQEG